MSHPDEGTDRSFESEVESIHEVVPERAVLTELARGFLLVHEKDREQAVQFAAGFLRERAGRSTASRVEPVNRVTMARLALGRFPQGAVERVDTRP